MRITSRDIRNIESEAGVIMTLIQCPEFVFYSDNLLPNHFSDEQNRYVYQAIKSLAEQNITTVDAYNIINVLNSNDKTRKYAEALPAEILNELIDMSGSLARKTTEEYKLVVSNVLDAALRRDTYNVLRECETLCFNQSEDLAHKIYGALDGVMMEFSSANEVPQFGEVVDDHLNEIVRRQGTGFAGIPFKFPTLNEYATIERGELFIFAAEATRLLHELPRIH